MYDALCGEKKILNLLKCHENIMVKMLSLFIISGKDNGTFAITVCPFQITYCL